MKTLLAIIEQGGYPDFTPLYQSLGYTVITAPSMRKGLGLLKQHRPDVIVAEFIYSPMYSARISNLESLFAALQNLQITPQLLVLIDKEDVHHLEKLELRNYISQEITYPVTKEKLTTALQKQDVTL